MRFLYIIQSKKSGMCKPILERYEPPDRTKSPTSIKAEISKELKARKARYGIDNSVKDAVILVDKENIRHSISKLCHYHNRHTKSQHVHKVADWLYSELKNFGYSDCHFHRYTQHGYNLENVICNKNGTNNDTILLCAHYDTILKEDIEDIESRAPGANDNASGVAALLEIARIISNLNLKKKIRFALFSGEEQGLWGSTHYAQYVKENSEDLYVVVNMDMCGETGYLQTNTTSYIDIDDGQTGTVISNNEASKNFGLKMEGLADVYTRIDTVFGPIDASDYMPFEAREYVCIGAYDGSALSTNPHYHDKTDTIDNLDFEFLSEVTKMVLAFIMTEAK
ncbi:M28 family metallopeptidase [soil metagenome]